MRYAKFEGSSFQIDSALSVQDAKELLTELNPAIANAEAEVDANGDYVFHKKAGTKGV